MADDEDPDLSREEVAGLSRIYRAGFEQSREALMVTDQAGFRYCNLAALKMFRVADRATFVNHHPADFSPPYQPDGRPSWESASKYIDEALNRGEAFFEWRHWTLDGVAFPTEVLLSRIDRDTPMVLGAVRDISDRKQAEAAQVLSTELLAASYDDFDATIQDALARIGRMAEADRSYLFQLADDGRTMSNSYLWCAEGVTAEIQTFQGLPTGDFNWLLEKLRHKGVLPIQSIAEIPEQGLRDHLARQGIQSLLLIPLVQGEKLTGFQGLDALGGERTWSESEQRLLRIAADALTGALARQRLQSELRYQARHDPLTGLVNRRPFEEALVREVYRAQRYSHTFALIMLDIDHFKAINDNYGHEVGDRILEELSTLVSNRLRESDLLARWGGEEFMALLPDTGQAGAADLAEDIRHQIADQDFPGVGYLTISLGVVEYRPYEEIKDVTRRVDEVLYAAKKGGRNRVVVAGEEPGA